MGGGLKLSDGVMIFPPGDQVLLPRFGGALGEGSYWYISEATYQDADGDALRLRVARRGLDGSELSPDPWPTVSPRPVLEAGHLTFSPIVGGLRRVVVRDPGGERALDAVLLGAETQLELADVAPGSTDVVEVFAPFDPLAFALPDVLAESLKEVERSSKFSAN